MYRSSADLLTVMLAAVVAAVLTVAPFGENLVRVALALSLVLVLPGYALTSAVFSEGKLDVPERLLLVPGLSLVLAILGGLVLNLTPWGLSTVPWVLLLSGTTLGAGALALARRQKRPMGVTRRLTIGLDARQGALVGLAILVSGVALEMSRGAAIRQQTPGFTQLWLLPRGTTSHSTTVQVGIHSLWPETTRYRLQILTGSSGHIVRTWNTIILQSGDDWSTTIYLPISGRGTIRANLYLTDTQSCDIQAGQRDSEAGGECASKTARLKIYRRVFLSMG